MGLVEALAVKCGTLLAIVLFGLGVWFIYETKGFWTLIFLAKNNIWSETFALRGKETEFELQTTGDLEWTGLKWEVNLQGNFSIDDYKEILELDQREIGETIQLIDKLHFSILQKGRSRTLESLSKSDFEYISRADARFLTNQLKNVVILSMKVVGWDLAECTLKRCNRVLSNYTNNLGAKNGYGQLIGAEAKKPNHKTGKIQYKKTFYLTTIKEPLSFKNIIGGDQDPMVIVIQRLHSLQPYSGWYSWLTFSYWWPPAAKPLEKSCFWFAHPIDGTEHRFIPKSIVSILFCY